MKNQIENLRLEVINANTAEIVGRGIVAKSCEKLYDLIQDALYKKYGEESIIDAYNDLCKGNFAEPFMCEQKKSKFELYSNIAMKLEV